MSKKKRNRIKVKKQAELVYSTNKVVNNLQKKSDVKLQVCVTKALSL